MDKNDTKRKKHSGFRIECDITIVSYGAYDLWGMSSGIVLFFPCVHKYLQGF